MLNERACGVLMHISSLPEEGGIGTFGSQAYRFVDFLVKASQRYWQILPLCPTGYGASPYQSYSTYAGNENFIDLYMLAEDGYIPKQYISSMKTGKDESSVDYDCVKAERDNAFNMIYGVFIKNPPQNFKAFCDYNCGWLEDYSLYMALKDRFGGIPFYMWEDDIKKRESQAIIKYKSLCYDRITYYKMLQYFFYHQWFRLKSYANDNGIKIIGDMPIYVAMDSADVWSNISQFKIDGKYNPIEVAGCPPDYFSADGQLWGNPVYDWKQMEQSKYSWWVYRIAASIKIYDLVRIDHFRGFDSYYCIKYGSKDARNGIWRKGPGMKLFNQLKKQLGDLPLIAEDLGFLTDSVKELLSNSGFPGMKVLQFAYDSRDENDYSPKSYPENSVVYTGTHDNDTILGWYSSAPQTDVKNAVEALGADNGRDLVWKMIDTALQSNSNTCILTMQDLLELDSHARMNTPSTVGCNWKWRAQKSQINDELAQKLKKHTLKYNRCSKEGRSAL